MTKRELIDHIISENRTADPSFLAQFNDEQLREYLAHLKWTRQPRLSGNAARFERYFRGLSVAGPAATATWRADQERQPRESQSPAPPVEDAAPVAEQEAPPQPTALQSPPESAFDELLLPPTEELIVEDSLSEEETLEDMQVTPQERERLRETPEEADDKPAGDAEKKDQPPFADPDPESQPWLF